MSLQLHLDMKQRTTLTLVRQGALLYPSTDDDYDILSGLGIPLNALSADFSPALLTFLPSNIKTRVRKFDELENEMLDRFKAKWKHGVSITPKAVVLTHPKDIKPETLEKAIASLKKWYRGHFIGLEFTGTRGSGVDRKTSLLKSQLRRRNT